MIEMKYIDMLVRLQKGEVLWKWLVKRKLQKRLQRLEHEKNQGLISDRYYKLWKKKIICTIHPEK